MTLPDLPGLISGLANLVAVLHIAFFLFIVGGTVAILTGAGIAHSVPLRLLHVAAVYVVLMETAIGVDCPLNTAQWTLRSAAIGQEQATTGVGGLLDTLLYRTIDGRILNAMYAALGVVLPILLFVVPPAWRSGRIRALCAESRRSSSLPR